MGLNLEAVEQRAQGGVGGSAQWDVHVRAGLNWRLPCLQQQYAEKEDAASRQPVTMLLQHLEDITRPKPAAGSFAPVLAAAGGTTVCPHKPPSQQTFSHLQCGSCTCPSINRAPLPALPSSPKGQHSLVELQLEATWL